MGSVTKATVPSVTKDEGRALRYAIGYVCRHLRKKKEEQNHELKEELIPCLVSLLKASDNEEECGTDEDWVKAQDRGGLLYVKETTYSLFFSIEGELRERLQALTGLEVTASADRASKSILFIRYQHICKQDNIFVVITLPCIDDHFRFQQRLFGFSLRRLSFCLHYFLIYHPSVVNCYP